MARIPIHTLDTAPDGSRDGLKAIYDRFGRVMNIQAEMAHHPVVLKTYIALKDLLRNDGTFDARIEQAIALAVSVVNGCEYCQAAHTLGGKAAGLTEEETVAIRKGTTASTLSWERSWPSLGRTPRIGAASGRRPGGRPSTPGGPTPTCSGRTSTSLPTC